MKRTATIAGIVGLILLAAIIALAFINSTLLLDLVLIITALVSLIAFALLGYAALQVVSLVKEVRGEVQTLVSTAKDTMAEVQGTARFVNETVVSPVAQAAGFVSATRSTIKSFTEPLYKRKS